jgi:hypothetical protein
MFGGQPMMPAQQFAPQYATPAPQYNVPAALASTAPARPAPPSQPMTTSAPRPVVRAQAAEAPAPVASRPFAPPPPERPAFVNLPAPEQLGVTSVDVRDWSTTHARLERLGVLSFQEQKLADGSCRFTCVLPMNGMQEHRIEAEASSAAEAEQVALAEAENWKSHN